MIKKNGSEEKIYFWATEIEFYLNDGFTHNDTFTHGDAEQRETGTWFFHDFNYGNYKGRRYVSVELTIGKGDYITGGVLIRSMMPVKVVS